jgi:citrate lyase subunit beta / citryl-CoA lyase
MAMRARRSCLAVPGSSPKMLSKAPSLPADQVFLDLEDSVAPRAKASARVAVTDALNEQDWSGKTVTVRVNAVETKWAAEDIRTVVEGAGEHIHCIMIPKVQHAHEVLFVDHSLRMIEDNAGLDTRIGLEAQIETALGLQNIEEVSQSSERLEALIFGPADMSASLGLPTVSVGALAEGYPGDQWHWVLETVLVAARAANLQAIDGPYLTIKDLDGLRASATRAQALGYDGKWALHPSQIDLLNEVFTPPQELYDKAEAILEAYERSTEKDEIGAVMFGNEMIDEASRKMALRLAERGRAADLMRAKSLEDFTSN